MTIQPNPLLEAYVLEQMEEFLYFIGQDTMPRPTIEWVEPTPYVIAGHDYNPIEDKHKLKLEPDMSMDQAHTAVLFHEFMHLVDTEIYVKKKSASISL